MIDRAVINREPVAFKENLAVNATISLFLCKRREIVGMVSSGNIAKSHSDSLRGESMEWMSAASGLYC